MMRLSVACALLSIKKEIIIFQAARKSERWNKEQSLLIHSEEQATSIYVFFYSPPASHSFAVRDKEWQNFTS